MVFTPWHSPAFQSSRTNEMWQRFLLQRPVFFFKLLLLLSPLFSSPFPSLSSLLLSSLLFTSPLLSSLLFSSLLLTSPHLPSHLPLSLLSPPLLSSLHLPSSLLSSPH